MGVLADYSRCIFRLFKPTDPYLLNMAVKGFWMFLVRVCLGAGAALAFYLAIRAGLIALGETRLDSGFNPWGTAGLSAIAGMFGGLVIERLWSTAQSLIGRPPASGFREATAIWPMSIAHLFFSCRPTKKTSCRAEPRQRVGDTPMKLTVAFGARSVLPDRMAVPPYASISSRSPVQLSKGASGSMRGASRMGAASASASGAPGGPRPGVLEPLQEKAGAAMTRRHYLGSRRAGSVNVDLANRARGPLALPPPGGPASAPSE